MIGLVAAPDPGCSLIILLLIGGRDVRGQEAGAWWSVEYELIKHDLNLRLGGMGPDRATEEEIKEPPESGRIKLVIAGKEWALPFELQLSNGVPWKNVFYPGV